MSDSNLDGVLVLIPARMASTRLPGKPLADICGLPMIVQVAKRAREAAIGRVVVAVDDTRVFDAVAAAGFEVVMTRVDHQSGSDRIFEALTKVDPDGKAKIIVNVQGDLPTIDPETVRAALRPLENEAVDIGTLTTEIDNDEDKTAPHIVKIVGSPISDSPAARALLHPRNRALRQGAALPSYRPLCLSARGARTVRLARPFDAGKAQIAGAAAGA